MRLLQHRISVVPVTMLLRSLVFFFFFNDPATTEIYTLSLHDALPIYFGVPPAQDTSAPLAPGSCRRALVAGSLPARPPPAPAVAKPSSRCDRTGAPTHQDRSQSAAPTPPAASPPPAPSRVRSA